MKYDYTYEGLFKELKRKGLTKQSLYEKYDISKAMIQKLTCGGNITLDTVIKLANKLDIDPNIIVTYFKK